MGDGDQITHVDYDVAPADLMNGMKEIVANVQDITASLKRVVGDEEGEQKLSEILTNINEAVAEVNKAVGANAPNNEICRAGLYCDIRADVEVGKEPYQGTCQPAVEPDQACELLGGFDVQCGLGHYCKEGKCTLAQAGGEPCEQGKHEQCASGYCNLFAGNTCLDLVQMVSEKDCGASTTGAGAN